MIPRRTTLVAAAICERTGGQTSTVSCTFAIASASAAGYAMYPIRHPAKPYAFDSEKSEIVRAVAPSNAAGDTWRVEP